MGGPTIRGREILAPRTRPAHSAAAEVGTTTVAVGLGALAGQQAGNEMIGMATTVVLKWLGGIARTKLSENPEGWKKYAWKLLSILG